MTFLAADACADDLASRLPGSKPYDLVTMSLVVPALSNPRKALRNLRSLARPNAPLIIAAWDGVPPLDGLVSELVEAAGD